MAAHVGLKARKVELALREEGLGGAAQIRRNIYIYTPYYSFHFLFHYPCIGVYYLILSQIDFGPTLNPKP